MEDGGAGTNRHRFELLRHPFELWGRQGREDGDRSEKADLDGSGTTTESSKSPQAVPDPRHQDKGKSCWREKCGSQTTHCGGDPDQHDSEDHTDVHQ